MPAESLLDAVARMLVQRPPRDCLLLCPQDRTLPDPIETALAKLAVTRIAAPETLEAAFHDLRFELALVLEFVETLPAGAARVVLARLRDLNAERTLVLTRDDADLTQADYIALGYRLHAAQDGDRLYGFDLYDYKDRPEWLNPKYWAHPELWDKYRW